MDVITMVNDLNLPENFDEEFPLFMTTVQDEKSNIHVNALQLLIYEDSPKERALNFKNQGNEHASDAFNSNDIEKKQRCYLRSLQCYSEGITQMAKDSKLNSILYCNRALINYFLGRFTDSIDDCRKSIFYDSTNIKSYYHAAKSSYKLSLYQQGINFCKEAQLQDFLNSSQREPIEKLLNNCKVQLENQQKKKQELSVARKDEDIIALLQQKRRMKVSTSLHYDLSMYSPQCVKYDGELESFIWPCLILYPEYNMSDFIVEMNENNSLIYYLKDIFNGLDFAEWDIHRQYTFNNLSTYLETNQFIIKIPLNISIKSILTKVSSVLRILVLYIMCKNTQVEQKFIEETSNLQLFDVYL